jgi:hypothetical protein
VVNATGALPSLCRERTNRNSDRNNDIAVRTLNSKPVGGLPRVVNPSIRIINLRRDGVIPA